MYPSRTVNMCKALRLGCCSESDVFSADAPRGPWMTMMGVAHLTTPNLLDKDCDTGDLIHRYR
jgi:hypothetical protein